MARRGKEATDDLTFAAMTSEPAEVTPRNRRAKASTITDPWDDVASECPLHASAEAHRVVTDGARRMHLVAYGKPIMCVRGAVQTDHRCIPDPPLPVAVRANGVIDKWNRTYAYAIAEDFTVW